MTRYVTLAEYLWLAEQVTGVDADALAKAARSELADSALQASQAGFGDTEFYPDVFDKAAVLVCRLAWNHRSPTATNALPGRRWCCSSTSTMGYGIPTRPTSTYPRKPCLRSPPVMSTKPGLRERVRFERGE